ncbi:MAG: hypothetical protein ABEH43_09870 [Flavobacteriales bacterium]
MKPWVKYGLLNALIGVVIGLYIGVSAIGGGYFIFVIAAPLAAFVTGGALWRLFMKNNINNIKVILMGLLTETVSHYIAFLLLFIGMNICFWTTGGCTGSANSPPPSISQMLLGGFGLSFFSLIFFGWITAPYSIIIGFIIK